MAEGQKKLPLTNVQRAYMIGRTSTFELGGCSTHVYYEFENDLDPERFYKALNEVISEQQMLRAVINSQGEETILDEVPYYSPEVMDWSDKSESETEKLTDEMRKAYSHEVMPSDKWPLFRFEFAKLPSGRYRLFAGFDLLVVDAGSFAALGKELHCKYSGEKTDVPVGSFEKYLQLLDTRKTKKKYLSDRKFWEEAAEDMPPAPSLPVLSADTVGNNVFRRKQFFIDSDTWSRTKEALSGMNVSSTVGVLACYSAVLGSRCTEDRFTLNLPMTNLIRRKKEMERVLGDFTEEMLLPLDKYKTDRELGDYITYVNQEFMRHFMHNYFDGIEVMALMRSKSGEKVSMPVVYTGMISDKSEFDNVDFFGDMVYGVSQTPQVTLDCQVFETHGRLKIVWDYVEKLFCQDDIDEMFSAFVELISSVGDGEKRPADILKISDKYERQLAEYNNTAKDIPSCTLLDLFRNTVKKCYDKTAVTDVNGSVTYGELDSLSDKAAAFLYKKGLRKGQRAAVIGNRTKETIVNMIAVLKCGAAYVPINPQYPEERRSYIYTNSGCTVIADGAPDSVDDISFEKAGPSPFDVAYVIYTSGSTGTPKGVVISHDSVCNTILDINERFGIGSDDKILSVSSFGFDLSVYDVFGAAAAGAEVVIAEDNRNIKDLAQTIRNKGITVWNSVPSIMELVADSLPDGYKQETLKNVLLSGDWIPVSLPDKIREKYPSAKVISLGGATEGSIWSVFYETGSEQGMSSIPYGYPLANQQMLILNENGEQVPCGVEGEICIGGRGVALCYDNSPEKTASAFVEHERFGRIYRTGDFGMMDRSGRMIFRGRRDDQVKIHGYRVELGEISSAIEKCSGIKQAIADISKNENNAYDILAYAVPSTTDIPSAELDMSVFDKAMEEFTKGISPALSADELCILNERLEQISTYYMKKFFAEHGAVKKGDIISVGEIISSYGIKQEYEGLILEWLSELCSDGWVSSCGKNFMLEADMIFEDEEKLWESIEPLSGSDKITSLKDYIRNCCSQHDGLFKGEVMPVSLFFHDSSSDVAKTIYTDNPISEYVNTITRKAITELIRSNNSGRPFRILEVGAGIGGTSAQLFGEIADLDVEYDFSDISDFFLNNAAERFGKYDFINYRFLDINKDMQSQGCSYGYYDMVFGVNVIHDAENLDNTIENIRSVLRSGGYFVMIETTANLRSQMVSLGFLEGLNPDYSDLRSETMRPFLTQAQWRELLDKHGFTPNSHYVTDEKLSKAVWQDLIIARNSKGRDMADEKTLKEQLRQIFPDYMIPSRVFCIDDIPLTVNGKVDRKKLPKPVAERSRTMYEAPATEMEIRLADIWQRTLNIEKVGVNDNFFELGGDSLNAIKIVTQCEKEGISIQLSDLYDHSTVSELAKAAVFTGISSDEEKIEKIYDKLDEDDLSNILSEL